MKIRNQIISLTAGIFLFAGTANAASYTVVPGDTLWKISNQYHISIDQLAADNALGSTMIYPGQVLKVPGPTPYALKKNDTLWLVSQKFGVTLAALLQANPQITAPDRVAEGMTVMIPDVVKAAAAKPDQLQHGMFPLPKGAYHVPLLNNYNDGRSWTPSGDAVRKHEGVDIFATTGTPVYSVLDGEIINFGWNAYGGWRVTVRTDSTTAFYYAHLSRYAPGIGKGSQVTQGQLLGYVGSTGYGPEGTEGQFDPHLHFGIYKTDQAAWYTIDPYPYLQWWESNQ
ncbi:MAG: hypothetical protein K0R57_588 [Paenibacillaceae bacterium]|nr:hypothetical protein [Paenibacillaceae bacterium]